MRHRGQTWACAAEPILGQAHANFQHKIFNDDQDTRDFQIKKVFKHLQESVKARKEEERTKEFSGTNFIQLLLLRF